ncbi:unnamed protein product [Caenorhabditis bovis]|uniref:Innexin n=1 Tax=Caenorhabditis bovis TaxID=2654633 RepID=A0A8S1EHN6_9PELO|nr:unnamed protein product [Caenorhabditis bovis]
MLGLIKLALGSPIKCPDALHDVDFSKCIYTDDQRPLEEEIQSKQWYGWILPFMSLLAIILFVPKFLWECLQKHFPLPARHYCDEAQKAKELDLIERKNKIAETAAHLIEKCQKRKKYSHSWVWLLLSLIPAIIDFVYTCLRVGRYDHIQQFISSVTINGLMIFTFVTNQSEAVARELATKVYKLFIENRLQVGKEWQCWAYFRNFSQKFKLWKWITTLLNEE